VYVYLFLEGPLEVQPNATHPVAAGYRTIVVDAILIIVNAILPCRRYSPTGDCRCVTRKHAMKSLLDSRDPSPSDIETSFAAQRYSYHNCGSALPISFQFNRQA
jgi:hypothetical protein